MKAKPKVDLEAQAYPEDFSGLNAPTTLWKNKVFGDKEYTDRWGNKSKGIMHLAGVGVKPADVMFVSACVTMEELYDKFDTKPRMLKGPAANLFERSLLRTRFAPADWYYTSLVKYNCPRLKPTAADIRWSEPVLDSEIRFIKPKIIVCLGKPVFDHLNKSKFKLKDVQGGFFRCETYDCLLYPMDSLLVPLMKPEFLERSYTDLSAVRTALDETRGSVVVKVPTTYYTATNKAELQTLMNLIQTAAPKAMAVDCEWDGQTYVNGRLRSVQLSWARGVAAYIRLMDDKLNYAMDCSMEEVEAVMAPVLNNPELKFVGHFATADTAWLKHHLGVDVYKRVVFDTMFAQHTLNEYADLKLERMAVKYTDLGRYDIPLTLWKKKSGFDEEDNAGYGKVPDKLLIPYALADVDCTLRLYPILLEQLIRADLLKYYHDYILPFVTDGFLELTETGLPINVEYLDDMRAVFSRNRDILNRDFRLALYAEAGIKLLVALSTVDAAQAPGVFATLSQLHQDCMGPATDRTPELLSSKLALKSDEGQEAAAQFKEFIGPDRAAKLLPVFFHWWSAPAFNANSVDQLRVWLFDVKGLTPLKTTKKDGIQLAWDRVSGLPATQLAAYKPAVDKGTLRVFAQQDKLVAQLEELKVVATILKTYLKEADVETGAEQGLHSWIQADDRIHANFALTETGRARAWKPNVFNFPKAVSMPIERAFKRIQDKYPEHSEKPTSLRSAVQAPDGWCIVDMDLKTAEVVALGYISGDENMIKVLTEPDVQFGRIDAGKPKKALRLCYNENEGIADGAQDASLIVSPDDPRFLRDAGGNIIHPKRDLHWEFGTSVVGRPREHCDEDLVRGIGKVGNFCILEDELVTTARGKVPIQDVRIDDMLWDGEEYVEHEGVVCNGIKQVHYYDGLWATDNHEVWSAGGEKIFFGAARNQRIELARASPKQSPGSGQEKTKIGRVYDILNAGPRHRYVCSDRLVSNSIPYGASAQLLERMLEVNTGKAPAAGTGQKMIESYESRYPVAARFLKYMESQVEDPGHYRSISGRVRHFHYHDLGGVDGLRDYTRKGILSGIVRQARNFPMQELVAATATKALGYFISERNRLGMKSRVFMLLYDAICLLAPLEEAKSAAALLKSCLTERIAWKFHGRTFSFEVDTGFSYRWGVKMTEDEAAQFAQHMY